MPSENQLPLAYLRSSTTDTGRSLPLALPVIGGVGNFASPGSITKWCSSEYHGPFTSADGAGSLSCRTYLPISARVTPNCTSVSRFGSSLEYTCENCVL